MLFGNLRYQFLAPILMTFIGHHERVGCSGADLIAGTNFEVVLILVLVKRLYLAAEVEERLRLAVAPVVGIRNRSRRKQPPLSVRHVRLQFGRLVALGSRQLGGVLRRQSQAVGGRPGWCGLRDRRRLKLSQGIHISRDLLAAQAAALLPAQLQSALLPFLFGAFNGEFNLLDGAEWLDLLQALVVPEASRHDLRLVQLFNDVVEHFIYS